MFNKKNKILSLLSLLLIVSSLFVTDLQAQEAISPTNSGVGFTIAETFKDPILAQQLANRLSAGDVDAQLTQPMVDSMTYLNLENTGISDLTGIGYLTSLTYLNVRNSNIVDIPAEIGNLTALQILDLTNNKITTLPKEIGALTNLRELFLETNQIPTIPIEIGNLSLLRTFIIGNNKLTSLPAQIGNLVALEYLHVYGNQLTSVPSEVANLTKMISFNVSGNLLPTDGAAHLSAVLPGVVYGTHKQLTLLPTATTVYPISNESDIANIDLASLVNVNNSVAAFTTHTYMLDNLVDVNGNAVSVSDFILNGIVQQTGSIYAQVRAQGEGVFPNNSDSAVTVNTIQLDFVATNYNLSFNLNGADSLAIPSQTLVEANKALEPVAPTKLGHTFTSWNSAADGSGMTWDFATTTMPANDVTLFAQWSVNQYPVDFDLNGATATTPASQNVNFNDLVNEPTNPIRDGYTFTGWNTNADGSGMTWDFMNNTMPANGVTLYAQWTVNQYQVDFNLNGAQGTVPDSQNVNFGDKVNEPTAPQNDGYTFAGWNTNADGTGMAWDFMNNTMPATDVTLYAQWTVNQYQVDFDLNGAQGTTPGSQNVNFKDLVKEPSIPQRDGYTFTGWNTKADGSGMSWDFMNNTMPANGVTLFAQWHMNDEVSMLPPVNPDLPNTANSASSVILGAMLIATGSILALISSSRKRATNNN